MLKSTLWSYRLHTYIYIYGDVVVVKKFMLAFELNVCRYEEEKSASIE